MEISIRPYSSADMESLLVIFNSNCPKYFAREDVTDFKHFLDTYTDDNFKVVVINGEIQGCGGHYVKHSEKVIGIAWVMFKRFAIGRGNFTIVSRHFFNHLLDNIKHEGVSYDIVINTTQLLEKLFMSFGFSTEKVIVDGFGEKLDHYVMRRVSNS